MKILLVSPYHGGSHRAWAEGFIQHSRHEIRPLTLPDRFWKWRMHGGAVTLARRFLAQPSQPDLLLATDMLDLTTFLALTRQRLTGVTAVLYMHENQLTYPLPADGSTGPMRRQLGERDHHYAFINYASMLAADHVLFNSHYHLDSFFTALPAFLKHFPEYKELGSVARLRQKSQVLPVGVDLTRLAQNKPPTPSHQPPLILWNQRWEYDKNPEAFFAALYRAADAGLDFQLALCGQQYGKRPLPFEQALTQLADRIVHVGHADLPAYRRLLWQAAVTISTAHHEFFGISILEAIACHTFPIVPQRLSYPELIGTAEYGRCFYSSEAELDTALRWALQQPTHARQTAQKLAKSLQKYDWHTITRRYDDLFQQLA